jgi:serine/threonine-protein kinase
VGRPTYTAPEVWEGARADRRVDIYSLGVVLWQLLTGRRMAETRPMGHRQAPAPSTINPEVGAALDDVVARALAPDPKQRHQQVGELQDALRPFLPSDLRAEAALAELLARHFDVTRERRMLAREVERALPLLSSDGAERAPRGPTHPPIEPEHAPQAAQPPVEPEPTAAVGPARPRVRLRGAKAVVAIGGVGLVLAGALVVGMRMAGPTASPAAQPMVAATPGPPPPPVTAVAPPATPETPPAAPEAPGPAPAPAPAPAHPIATSAARARPPSAKAARPIATPASADSADDLLRRAQDRFDVGDTQTALALARQAAAAGARGAAHILMGKVMMSERRFDEAENAFAEAVRLDPHDARAARLLSLVRETRRGGP